MQNKTYVITAMIDGWEFALARDVPEEEVEGELQHLTRRHELKNVGRYEIRPSESQTAYPRPSEGEAERGRRSQPERSEGCSRPSPEGRGSRTARAAPDAFPADDRKGGGRGILNTSSITTG
jgi:hypothetical protein